MKEKNCVMIEVGRTGLTMGYLLKETGWKITILEARERIGDRIFTYRFLAFLNLRCQGKFLRCSPSAHLSLQQDGQHTHSVLSVLASLLAWPLLHE